MLDVAIKGNGIRHLRRQRPDLDGDSQRRQRRHELLIKICYRAWPERKRLSGSFAGLNQQAIRKKIELILKNSAGVRDRRCRSPTWADVERHFPPMVDKRV